MEDNIRLDSRNYRKHDDCNKALINKSLQELGAGRSIVIDKENGVVCGNGVFEQAKKLGIPTRIVETDGSELVVVKRTDLATADEKRRKLAVADNAASDSSEFDLDLLHEDFDVSELQDMGIDIEDGLSEPHKAGVLSEKYLIPPFSVLNAKSGEWQDRKRAWIDLGIESEKGRDDALLITSLSGSIPDYYEQKNALEARLGREVDNKEFEEKYLDKSGIIPQTSLFDPVLCEVAYSWFAKDGYHILDPFAGGSVRGIVAHHLGRRYTGIDLRKEQIEANFENAAKIMPDNIPNWLCGDSNEILDTLEDAAYDMVLSCPPYADLEVYSDDPDDLSNMEYGRFLEIYRSIIAKTYAKMKDDTFAVWVVGEVRAKGGNYYNFLGDTIKAFMDAGFAYYNEIVLETAIGTSALRVGNMFRSSRKVCKVHQNVLVFLKGDARKAAEKLGNVEIKEFLEESEETP